MIAKLTDLRLYRFDYSTLASPYIYKRAQNLDDFEKAAFVNKKNVFGHPMAFSSSLSIRAKEIIIVCGLTMNLIEIKF